MGTIQSYLIAIAFLFLTFIGYSQNNLDPRLKTSYISDKVNIKLFHNTHDLSKINKTVLKNIFIDRVIIFNELLPFIALKLKPGTELHQMQLPYDKKRYKRQKKFIKVKGKYHDYLKEDLSEIVNYADSDDIVEQIIMLEKAINDIITFLYKP